MAGIAQKLTLPVLLSLVVGPGTAQKVAVTSTAVGVATNLRSNGRQPVVFAPRPDGSGALGYTDTKGNARVLAVDRRFRKTGGEAVIEGHRLVALHADADGAFTLLVSTEEGPNDLRPAWSPGDNALYAVRVSAQGKVLWKTHLLGGKGFGPQQKWFVNGSAAALGFNGEVYGAFYSAGKNFAPPGNPPNSHEGDEFKAFEADGGIREDLSQTWNCSHSKDQRLVVDGSEFRTLTMGDTYPLGVFYKAHPTRTRGVVWPATERAAELRSTYRKSFMPGDLGGIALLGDGLAAVATTFVRDGPQKSFHDAERLVLFLRFDKSGALAAKRYLTTEPERRGMLAYVGRFGPHALVGWSVPGRRDTMLAVLKDDASYVVKPWRTKHALGPRAGFVSMPNGDLVWAYGRQGGRKIELQRAVLPKSFRTAGEPPRATGR